MKPVATLIGSILLFSPVIFLASSEFFAKKEASIACGNVKPGMKIIEVYKLAKDNGVTHWQEENENISLSVSGGMGSRYFCRIKIINGSVISVGEILRMPGM